MPTPGEGGAVEVLSVVDHRAHTRFSDPGPHAALVAALPQEPSALARVARNVIVHYRVSAALLPQDTREEVNCRWIEATLAADQARHPWPLDEERELSSRVQGCCRDHTLFCVAALRHHGIPARSRVGFAGYFTDGWHHDHVIVEAWMEGRWRRFDAEVAEALPSLPTPMDIEQEQPGGSGFLTAAQAWTAYRVEGLPLDTYGVAPDLPGFRGQRFVFGEVIYEVAHRFGDELLLWDLWGRIDGPRELSEEDERWMDQIAALLLAADGGDVEAERLLLRQYRADDGLHPGATVVQGSPFGGPSTTVPLAPH